MRIVRTKHTEQRSEWERARERNSYAYWEKGGCLIFAMSLPTFTALNARKLTVMCFNNFKHTTNLPHGMGERLKASERKPEWVEHTIVMCLLSMCLLLDTDHWETKLTSNQHPENQPHVTFISYVLLLDYFSFALHLLPCMNIRQPHNGKQLIGVIIKTVPNILWYDDVVLCEYVCECVVSANSPWTPIQPPSSAAFVFVCVWLFLLFCH